MFFSETQCSSPPGGAAPTARLRTHTSCTARLLALSGAHTEFIPQQNTLPNRRRLAGSGVTLTQPISEKKTGSERERNEGKLTGKRKENGKRREEKGRIKVGYYSGSSQHREIDFALIELTSRKGRLPDKTNKYQEQSTQWSAHLQHKVEHGFCVANVQLREILLA